MACPCVALGAEACIDVCGRKVFDVVYLTWAAVVLVVGSCIYVVMTIDRSRGIEWI